MASILLPDEVAEIAEASKRPWSKKKLKRWNDGEIQCMPAALASTTTTADAPVHREKLAPLGDQLDPLVAWYSLVAKPIPRQLWASYAEGTGSHRRGVAKAP